MAIYFHSLPLTTPLGGGIGKKISRLLKDYLKNNGFIINNLNEFGAFYVKGLETICEFHEKTVAGDRTATYMFSVATAEKEILDRIIFDTKKILSQLVMSELVKDHLVYKLMEEREAFYEFNGDWCQAVRNTSRTDTLYKLVTANGVALEVQPN